MFSNQWINRLVIIAFMVIVGYCLANAIYSKSFIAITLALVSLGAGIYFVHLMQKFKEVRARE